MRWLAVFALCLIAVPAYAGLADDIADEIYEGDSIKGDQIKIKSKYRTCSGEGDCTAVLSLCRWRAVNKNSQKYTREVSERLQLECKWPPPPATPPVVRCIEQRCEILPDGKFY